MLRCVRGLRALGLFHLCVFLLTPARSKAQSAEMAVSEASRIEETRPVTLLLQGECPRREAVARELGPLLRHFHIAKPEASAAAAIVTVTDEGRSFSLQVLDTKRRIEDEALDCDERARIAAVLIAMALEPAQGPLEDVKPAVKPATSGPAPAVESVDPPIEVSAELSAMAGFGFAVDGVGRGIGPLVGLRVGRGAWAVRLGAGLFPSEEHRFDAALVTLRRFPMDLGVAHAFGADDWSIEPALGVAFDPFTVEVEGLAAPNREVRLDVGPRATLQISSGSTSVRAIAALRATWFPRPYELVVNPTGQVGTTAEYRLELALGLRLNLY